MVQLSHLYMTTGKTVVWTTWTLASGNHNYTLSSYELNVFGFHL